MKKLWKPALLLAAVAIMAYGAISSGAWFTDTATTQTSTIKAGTLSLDNSEIVMDVITINDMVPGDKSEPVEIVIKNDGTEPLAWFGDMQISESILKNAVYIEDAKMEFFRPDGSSWEPTDNFIKNGMGYTSNGANTFATLAAFNNNPGMAPQTPYEFMGALKPGYSYKLTLVFGFDKAAGNEYQNAGPITIKIKYDATQIDVDAMNALLSPLGNHFNWMNQQIAKQ
jgi:hypothetical protein